MDSVLRLDSSSILYLPIPTQYNPAYPVFGFS